MKIIIFLFLFIYSYADSVKTYAVSCEKQSSLEGFIKATKSHNAYILPKDCFYLTKNAQIKVLGIIDNQIVKIMLVDLNKTYFALKKDLLIKNSKKNLTYY